MVRRKVLVGILAVVAVVGLVALSCIVGMEVVERFGPPPRVVEPEEITTPLDSAVVRDLCSALGLSEDSWQCKPGAVVYAPDFNPAIRRAFREGAATRQEVDSKLGAYRYECEEPVKTNLVWRTVTLVRCHYDLKGDRMYTFAFYFNEKGVVYRLIFGGPGS